MKKAPVKFRSLLKIFLLSIFLSLGCFASDLHQKTGKIIASTGEDLNVGIYIQDLDSNEIKFASHENRKFVPASTTKLFTAYAGLKYLGKNFQYRTLISADNPVKGSSTDGSVYIQFSGDPTLSYDDIKRMMSRIGVKEIKGNLVLNDYLFDHHRTSPGGFAWDDHPFCYAAPKSAIIIDRNCSEAKMWPNKVPGIKANLEISNPSLLSIDNNVDTVKPSSQECPYKSRYLGGNAYEVYGCMFKDIKRPVRLNFALQDNRLMAEVYFQEALKEIGIKVSGSVIFSNVHGKYLLHTHKSAPLKDVIVPLLHDSLNPDASSLFKYLGYQYTRQQGSDETGENMMNQFLRQSGLKNGVRLKDGSGESRYNLITPKALVLLLDKAYKSDVRDYFLFAIPQYGSKGTLRYRSIDSRFKGDVRAKTGSMKNTSSLAGYYLPSYGKKYAFAIMVNGHGLSPYRIREMEDQILNAILSN